MLLADAAEAIGGKLYVLGGGWSITGPDPSTFAIAVKVEVPWNEANAKHEWELTLVDEDSREVKLGDPPNPVRISAPFEVGRPAGLKAGTPLDMTFAIKFVNLPIPPGGRYVWRLSIDGETREDWSLAFTSRPQT